MMASETEKIKTNIQHLSIEDTTQLITTSGILPSHIHGLPVSPRDIMMLEQKAFSLLSEDILAVTLSPLACNGISENTFSAATSKSISPIVRPIDAFMMKAMRFFSQSTKNMTRMRLFSSHPTLTYRQRKIWHEQVLYFFIADIFSDVLSFTVEAIWETIGYYLSLIESLLELHYHFHAIHISFIASSTKMEEIGITIQECVSALYPNISVQVSTVHSTPDPFKLHFEIFVDDENKNSHMIADGSNQRYTAHEYNNATYHFMHSAFYMESLIQHYGKKRK